MRRRRKPRARTHAGRNLPARVALTEEAKVAHKTDAKTCAQKLAAADLPALLLTWRRSG